MEGQWQGSEAAGFIQGGGLTVGIRAAETGPGESLCGGGQWGGGHRRRLAGAFLCVVREGFFQVGFDLLQLRQCGVDFQRT